MNDSIEPDATNPGDVLMKTVTLAALTSCSHDYYPDDLDIAVVEITPDYLRELTELAQSAIALIPPQGKLLSRIVYHDWHVQYLPWSGEIGDRFDQAEAFEWVDVSDLDLPEQETRVDCSNILAWTDGDLSWTALVRHTDVEISTPLLNVKDLHERFNQD